MRPSTLGFGLVFPQRRLDAGRALGTGPRRKWKAAHEATLKFQLIGAYTNALGEYIGRNCAFSRASLSGALQSTYDGRSYACKRMTSRACTETREDALRDRPIRARIENTRN